MVRLVQHEETTLLVEHEGLHHHVELGELPVLSQLNAYVEPLGAAFGGLLAGFVGGNKPPAAA
jgi:hypothetical protein